jgi:hypothetical protein
MSRVEDAFVLVEVVKQRFDDIYDRAEMLSRLIASKERAGADTSELRTQLNEAETERSRLLAALRNARLRKSIPISSIASAGPLVEQRLAGRAGGL